MNGIEVANLYEEMDMSIAGTFGKAVETQDGISIISCFNEVFISAVYKLL